MIKRVKVPNPKFPRKEKKKLKAKGIYKYKLATRRREYILSVRLSKLGSGIYASGEVWVGRPVITATQNELIRTATKASLFGQRWGHKGKMWGPSDIPTKAEAEKAIQEFFIKYPQLKLKP